MKKLLISLKTQTKSKKKLAKLQVSIAATEDAHPRRPRSKYAGEMLQMDASPYPWYGDEVTSLHIAVDDATGNIVGAYFDNQETLKGYYNVFHQILTNYGIPYMFFTDNRTVFEYKSKKMTSVEEDTTTQFGYACKQLGVEIQTSSVVQAKGRVERMFQTLQSRIPVLLRLAGITAIEAANKFLDSYIKEFNKQFALPLNNIKSVFEKQPSEEKINLILAVLTNRKIDSGSCIKFKNDYYIPVNSNGYPVHYIKGTSAIVIKSFDDQLFACINEEVYALDLIPSHQTVSKKLDILVILEEPKKHYIPPKSHPWGFTSFMAYVDSQKHRESVPS